MPPRAKTAIKKDYVVLKELLVIPLQLLSEVNEQLQEYTGGSAKQRKKILASMDTIDKLYSFHIKYATEYARLSGILDRMEELESQTKQLKEGSRIAPVSLFVTDESALTGTLSNLFTKMGINMPESVLKQDEE